LDHLSGQGGPFWNGEVMSTMPDPELGETIEWAKLKRMPLVGSYSQQVFISSTTDSEGLPAILVSGNPAKWFQGHNVFGSDDLPGLVLEMLLRICATAGVTPSAENLRCWYAGRIELLRVDVTNSWDLLNRARVRAALKALDATAHLRHRGRGQFYGDALTFGGGGKNKPGSRRWSLRYRLTWLIHHFRLSLTVSCALKCACWPWNSSARSYTASALGETIRHKSCTLESSQAFRSQTPPCFKLKSSKVCRVGSKVRTNCGAMGTTSAGFSAGRPSIGTAPSCSSTALTLLSASPSLPISRTSSPFGWC
jgi:hypothetical protein